MAQVVYTDDAAGFQKFCEAEWPRLARAMQVYTGNRETAEDLAQEALARAYQRWSAVAQMDAPHAWVRRVALNLATSRWRRVRLERAELERRKRDPEGPGDRSAEAVERLDLAACLAQMPARERAVLAFRFYLDLPAADVADRLGMSTDAVRSLTKRAIARLRVDPNIADQQEGDLDDYIAARPH